MKRLLTLIALTFAYSTHTADPMLNQTCVEYYQVKTSTEEFNKCIRDGNKQEVINMLDANIDPNKEYRGWEPPLLAAVESGNLEIIETLLKKGTKITSHNNDGETALHKAAIFLTKRESSIKSVISEHKALEMVTFLHKHGLGLNSTNKKGETALCYAALADYPSVINYLLKNDVDPETENLNGKTAITYARGNGLKILKEHDKDDFEKDPLKVPQFIVLNGVPITIE